MRRFALLAFCLAFLCLLGPSATGASAQFFNVRPRMTLPVYGGGAYGYPCVNPYANAYMNPYFGGYGYPGYGYGGYWHHYHWHHHWHHHHGW